ncbi:extracellular solute-binding protein [Paenibacillus filicis]|uniref:Extracellular solute-binding protein n=1 Tax=Paenibacillus filicis TaxID=669464 RepID=A0ABU9DCG0_9BACL
MNRRQAMLLSLIALVGLSAYWVRLSTQNFYLVRQSPSRPTVELWASTSAFYTLAEQFQREHADVSVKVRLFANPDVLLHELSAADSAGTPPDLAEIGADFGIASFVERGHIAELTDRLPERLRDDFLPGIASRFQMESQYWAMPVGFSLPVLYYNQSLLSSNRFALGGELTWEELWTKSRQLMDKVHQTSGSIWGFHTDARTPAYLLAMHPGLLDRAGEAHTGGPEGPLKPQDAPLWMSAVRTHALIPPLTHQRAAGQFVQGQGAVLLSFSDKYMSYMKLIAERFELGVRELPYTEDGRQPAYSPGGTGLMLFKSDPEQENRALSFLRYAAEPASSVALSLESGYAPARRSVLAGTELQQASAFRAVLPLLLRGGEQGHVRPASPYDQALWQRLLELQEGMEIGQLMESP